MDVHFKNPFDLNYDLYLTFSANFHNSKIINSSPIGEVPEGRRGLFIPQSKPRFICLLWGKAEVRVAPNDDRVIGQCDLVTERGRRGLFIPKANQDYVCLLWGERRYELPAGSQKIFDLLGCFTTMTGSSVNAISLPNATS